MNEKSMSPEPIKPTPEGFGVVTAAVFDIQRTLGEHIHNLQSLNMNYAKDHDDKIKMEENIKSLQRLIKLNSVLLSTIGVCAAWFFLRIWELILPLLQLKLGLPIK